MLEVFRLTRKTVTIGVRPALAAPSSSLAGPAPVRWLHTRPVENYFAALNVSAGRTVKRSVDISGTWLVYALYAVTAAILVALLVVLPLHSAGNVSLTVFLVGLLLAFAIGAWRLWTGRDPEYLPPSEDIANDPFAYPGHMAKHNWEKAVSRLPGNDDEED